MRAAELDPERLTLPLLRPHAMLLQCYTGQVAVNRNGRRGAQLPDAPTARSHGEVSEWLKEHAWKACLLERVTWVRIPPSPPADHYQFQLNRNARFSAYL